MKGLILACLIGFNTYPPVTIQEAEQNYINVNEISEIKWSMDYARNMQIRKWYL